MTHALRLLSLLALAPMIATAATPQASPAPRKALRGADCLDPTAARTWDHVSGDQLLVDAGRRKYRIELAEHCGELGHGSSISFKGDPISGRICGNFGEAVQVRGMSCRIQRIERLDADTYEAARTGRRGPVSN